jgi:hypothetical protein
MEDKKASVARFASTLAAEFADKPLVVFLCGPSISSPKPSAELRLRLQAALELSGFEVVLGEDDGLGSLQALYKMYAHQNELRFVEDQAAAIVLIADSPGSFCELGMFADRYSKERDANSARDFILVVDEQYASDPSYVNLGPALAVTDFGIVYWANFRTFDVEKVTGRLSRRRSLWMSEKRGRPRGASVP